MRWTVSIALIGLVLAIVASVLIGEPAKVETVFAVSLPYGWAVHTIRAFATGTSMFAGAVDVPPGSHRRVRATLCGGAISVTACCLFLVAIGTELR